MKIDIQNLDSAEVLCAFYEHAGMFPRALPLEKARQALSEDKYIDYLNARAIKMNFQGPLVDLRLYCRDQGYGAVCAAMKKLGITEFAEDGQNTEVSDAHPAADVGKHENRERGECSQH